MDIILNFGDEWIVKRVNANFNTEEVDVFIEYLGKEAEDPDTLEACPIYDRALSRRWRHLDTMQYKTYINSRVPRIRGVGRRSHSALLQGFRNEADGLKQKHL